MSKPPRALIAEDEPLLAESLRADLARLWPDLQVLAPAGDGQAALELALRERPAVCFLDIRMPAMSGLEAAQALAEDWPDEAGALPLLVFVTAYDQYALQAFGAQAVDYLVKPVQPQRLADCVRRLQARLAERQAVVAQGSAADAGTPGAGGPSQGAGASAEAAQDALLAQLRALLAQRVDGPGPGLSTSGTATTPATGAAAAALPRLEVIQASVGDRVHFVPVDEVLYFEAADKYVRVVTAQREHLIRLSLRELLPQLDAAQFWQVHRAVLVRTRMIESAQRLESGKLLLSLRGRSEKLPVSRLYAHLFKGL